LKIEKETKQKSNSINVSGGNDKNGMGPRGGDGGSSVG